MATTTEHPAMPDDVFAMPSRADHRGVGRIVRAARRGGWTWTADGHRHTDVDGYMRATAPRRARVLLALRTGSRAVSTPDDHDTLDALVAAFLAAREHLALTDRGTAAQRGHDGALLDDLASMPTWPRTSPHATAPPAGAVSAVAAAHATVAPAHGPTVTG